MFRAALIARMGARQDRQKRIFLPTGHELLLTTIGHEKPTHTIALWSVPVVRREASVYGYVTLAHGQTCVKPDHTVKTVEDAEVLIQRWLEEVS